MMKESHLFDTSNYPPNSKYFSNHNKKKIGAFKDEIGGELIYEFVGLRPKLYSIQGYVQRKQAAKGIQKSIANSITHQAFKNTLLQKTTKSVQTMRIESQKHLVQTIQVNKIALSPFDDKR